MLLIITNCSDLACDYLILRLKERKIPFIRFNTDLFPEHLSFDISIIKNIPSFSLRLENGSTIESESITAVYFRQPILPTLKQAENSAEKEFAETELTEMLRSLWRIIPESYWLNHPRRLWLASNKLEQLLVAASFGFSVPDTLISCRKESINSFLVRKDVPLIAKAIKNGFVRNGEKMLLAGTQRLSENFIQHLDEYASIPMTYQEEIEKGIDLRVVVVGDYVFPASITAVNCDHIDWRVADIGGAQVIHKQAKLPQNVKKRLLSIVKHFGLNYSSIDMIQNRQGEYFFLELNPNGQWAWIEQLTGFPIRDAIIDTLMRK